MHDYTTDAISKCHQFLRDSFGNDPSVVSLRKIAWFTICVEFFQDFFFKKDNFLIEDETIKNSLDVETKILNRVISFKTEDSLDDETKKLYKINKWNS